MINSKSYSVFVYYYGGEDNQAFCLKIAIRERVYILKAHNYRDLLITASLEASKEASVKYHLPYSYCTFGPC